MFESLLNLNLTLTHSFTQFCVFIGSVSVDDVIIFSFKKNKELKNCFGKIWMALRFAFLM